MMRELSIGKNSVMAEGRELNCEYIILVDESGGSVPCENYGVKVILEDGMEMAELYNISPNAERIEDLAKLLYRNMVTPCTLLDVVGDWL